MSVLMTAPLLGVDGLTIEIRGRTRHTIPVRGVTFAVRAGERLAIVGESGSGKSMTATAVLGLLPPGARITAGTITLDGAELTALSDDELRGYRGSVMSLIPQDPLGSLNPVRRVGWQIVEAIQAHERVSRVAARARAAELLTMVGIDEAADRLDAYPHEFSGGMRQRVLIAMALALRPRLLIADEPTTALDVTVQAQVLDLIDQLASEAGSAVILITHDLAVAAGRTDSIVVMRDGQVKESGPTARVLTAPATAYTRDLLESSPDLRRPRKSRFVLRDQREEVPS
ncbi:ABC transporter ATP-binding protein [Jiangella anatolica]|uniref:ABC transporter ATP-binding protein n=1 Tax=Jiangella anatolica TaxID=2670374 RepID=UPI001F2C6A10|nr:ABC transporter ATP-binding protein [Jiangella anatolica]